jgi:STE24 endopeptidase
MFDLLTAAASTGGFDVETATLAYLDTLQGAARDSSDAYFEGGHWLILWGALVAILVDWLILRFRMSAGFRNLGEKVSKRRWIVTWITAFLYTVAGWLMILPWTIFTEFFREKQYDLLDQTFGAWFGETMIDFAISLVVIPFLIVAIYAVIRRAPTLS